MKHFLFCSVPYLSKYITHLNYTSLRTKYSGKYMEPRKKKEKFRILHNKELLDLYRPLSIVRIVKFRMG
jgi:hypothetical protein